MRINPNSLGFTILLGIIAALPPLSIDMALPALPIISTSLHTSSANVGLTLSLFMIGYAGAQLFFGPFSDRYGRKPALILACGIFTIAGFGCTFAPSINILVIFRLFQGAGAGAGMTLMLATVRDLFEGDLARAQLSYVNLVMTVAPMIAPTMGGLLLTFTNWRAIYGLLALGGFLLIIIITLGLNESIKKTDLNALKLDKLIKNYRTVLSHPICLNYAIVNALSFGCIFTYIAGSPLVMLKVFNFSTTTYGILFALTALGIMVGSFVSGRLNLQGIPSGRLLDFGLIFSASSAIGLVIVSVMGINEVSILMFLLIFNTFCYGIIAPNATHNSLQPLPEIAGVAAALLGFLRMLAGAAASSLVSFLFDGTSIAMSMIMAGFAIAALVNYIRLRFMPIEI